METSSDLPDAVALSAEQGYLLSLFV